MYSCNPKENMKITIAQMDPFLFYSQSKNDRKSQLQITNFWERYFQYNYLLFCSVFYFNCHILNTYTFVQLPGET